MSECVNSLETLADATRSLSHLVCCIPKILPLVNNLAINVIHTTYIILLFTDFTMTCFDSYMIIFRSCHLILGILNHVLQLHILITLCMS
jgi:hypothetical protein